MLQRAIILYMSKLNVNMGVQGEIHACVTFWLKQKKMKAYNGEEEITRTLKGATYAERIWENADKVTLDFR